MEQLTKELMQNLLSVNKNLCFSLYMPTHRTRPENHQDPIRFKNLVRQMENSLLQKYSKAEAKEYLEPFQGLLHDQELWNNTLDGLAVFGANGLFKVVGLRQSVDELAIVADSFHTKPLRKYLQSVDRYHVLGLSLHGIRLFEGNRHSLDEIELTSETPKTITDALGYELTDKHLSVASYGGAAGQSTKMYHGHGGYKEEAEKDAERFFRIIADVIYEKYSKPTGWPLILVALTEHHNLFHKVSKNPYLNPEGIVIDPLTVSTDQLIGLAWKIMEPAYLQKLDSVIERYGQARANDKGSDDYKEVAVAAVEGRVEMLIVEEDRILSARITNQVTGNTQKKDIMHPKVDDLLDDMGELVTKMGGEVMVLPAAKMASKTGLAAIYRY